MFVTKQHQVMARTVGVAILAAASLSACATYDDEFAGINTRLDQLDARVQGAAQSASTSWKAACRTLNLRRVARRAADGSSRVVQAT